MINHLEHPKIDTHAHQHYYQTEREKRWFKENGFPYIEKEGEKYFLVLPLDKRPVETELILPEKRIEMLDTYNIVHQVLWMSPWVYQYDCREKKLAKKFTQLHNDKMMEQWITPHKDLFSGAFTIPMQFPEEAIRELHRCYELGYRAVTIGTTVNGEDLSDEKYQPIFDVIEELGLVVCVHPHELIQAPFWSPWTEQMPARTSQAMEAFTYGLILHKHRKLKVMFSHGGVNWLCNFGRKLHGYQVRPDLTSKKGCPHPYYFLTRIRVDSHTSDPMLTRFLVEKYMLNLAEYTNGNLLVFGTDAPFPLGEWPNDIEGYTVYPGQSIIENDFGYFDKVVKKNILLHEPKRFFQLDHLNFLL